MSIWIKAMIALAILGAVSGLGLWVYSTIKDQGRQEVIEQVEDDNKKLDDAVSTVNENLTVRVQTDDATIRVQSEQVEDVINEMPDESISNVTRARLERVRQQQRNLSETNTQTE